MLSDCIKRIFLYMVLGCVWSIWFNFCCFAQNDAQDDRDSRIILESSKNDTSKVRVKSPTGALLRSLVFPGWGQLYNGKYIKAVLVFGAETGLVANSIYLNQKCQASKTDAEREFYINNRNLSNWWLVGVILFSMADAFVDAHLYQFDESPDLSSLNFYPIISENKFVGIQLYISRHF